MMRVKNNKEADNIILSLNESNSYMSTIDRYETQIAQLAEKLPKPKYQVGDIVMLDGFRKVKITEVLVKDNKHWWSRVHKFTFAYQVENVLTEEINRQIDGVTHICSFEKAPCIVKEEQLEEVPDNYETYLCHIIYDLTHEKRRG